MPRARRTAHAGGQPHHRARARVVGGVRRSAAVRARRPGRSRSCVRSQGRGWSACRRTPGRAGGRPTGRLGWSSRWRSLRTPRHTAIVCPCALAAKSIPASMKWPVVPIWRIGPQWPEVPRARARIVSGPVIGAGRPLPVALCTHATITSPRPLTATAGRTTMNRPSETRTGEPHGLPGRFTAARTAPSLAQVSAAVPSRAHRELELDVGAARHRRGRPPRRRARRRRQHRGHG